MYNCSYCVFILKDLTCDDRRVFVARIQSSDINILNVKCVFIKSEIQDHFKRFASEMSNKSCKILNLKQLHGWA